MDSLITGAYDLHVHSAPDVMPRLMDDLDMIGRVKESGMAGYVIKSHYFCTAERASIINKMQSDCRAIGAITLNSAVGGINPTAVEMAGRAGAKLVWFPTCDSRHERSHVFNGDPNKKLPYWAKILIQMKEEGIEALTISILDDNGELIPAVNDVLDIIKKILAQNEYSGMTVTAAMGCGRQKADAKDFEELNLEMNLLPKIQVDVVVSKVPVRTVIETAKKVLYTGHIGDGKIFVYDVENVVKVRTGEEGFDALQDVE